VASSFGPSLDPAFFALDSNSCPIFPSSKAVSVDVSPSPHFTSEPIEKPPRKAWC
jgi:hypothetical protein